jgi:hypothetical protein
MAFIIKDTGTDFEPAPEGLQHCVCVDVADLGMKDTQWGAKHKLRLVWELDQKMKDGRPYIVSAQFTVSLHPKSGLRKTLESWRGKKFTEQELAGFDLENLLGANAQVQVIHNTAEDGRVWANVATIVRDS